MKKILIFLLIFVLVGCQNTENQEEVIDMSECSVNESKTVEATVSLSAEDLWTNSIVCENVIYEDDMIKHLDPLLEGAIETDVFYIDSFSELVPSWNVLIDDDSSVSFFISIGNETGMSDYFLMGFWRARYMLSSGRQENEYGKVYIDTVVTNVDDIDRIKIKIVIGDSETNQTAIRNFSVTTKQNNEVTHDLSVLDEKVIDVAPRQQMSVPVIGSRICSPTSLSMVLNYYGFSDPQDIVASNVLDKGADIYGNWSFNASYPGGFGLYSRVEYINDLQVLMNYIEQDIPVVLSIKTTDKAQLEGSLMAYSSGHLVVLIGFTKIDDEWYAVVNDPAEYTDEAVTRHYKASQLLEVWRGYSYIISSENI